jgi:RNA polymerase sigma factor (sigma-70 family)
VGERELFPWDPGPRGSRDANSWLEAAKRIVASVVAQGLRREQDREAVFDQVMGEILACLSAGSCPDPRTGGHFLSWVYWRARWRRADRLRRDQVRRRRVVPLERAPGEALVAPEVEYVSFLRGLDLSFLQRWIDHLPNEGWKAELHMSYFERLTSQEIGKRLGIPPGTVRADLSHARAELRRLYRRELRRLLDGESPD